MKGQLDMIEWIYRAPMIILFVALAYTGPANMIQQMEVDYQDDIDEYRSFAEAEKFMSSIDKNRLREEQLGNLCSDYPNERYVFDASLVQEDCSIGNIGFYLVVESDDMDRDSKPESIQMFQITTD